MKKEKSNTTDAFLLRLKAEKQLKKDSPAKTTNLTEAETMRLLHELEVHQIELEMQNDELLAARNQAKTANDKYNSLYDLAHNGYFTLLSNGKISALNLSGAQMLGRERANLVNQNFKQFVTLDFISEFNDFFERVYKTYNKETCEVRVISKGKPSIFVHIEGIVSGDDQKCYLTLIDISKQKRTESILQLKALEIEQFNELINVSAYQMIELKKEINSLLRRLGEKEKFNLTE